MLKKEEGDRMNGEKVLGYVKRGIDKRKRKNTEETKRRREEGERKTKGWEWDEWGNAIWMDCMGLKRKRGEGNGRGGRRG